MKINVGRQSQRTVQDKQTLFLSFFIFGVVFLVFNNYLPLISIQFTFDYIIKYVDSNKCTQALSAAL